jgi:exopolysaccharide biosynthesis polyprenyl glycosylphosphotransferase
LQGRAGVGNFQQSIKRLADIFLAVVGLVILSPVFPLLGLAIRLDSPGPILYRQIRCGKAGKPFSIIKLRTMKIDAEEDGKARWATERDPRITRVGFYLRKTRLDELPQLLNMLKGEMSFIGPRPERPEFVKELQEAIPFYRTRLMVKPGLTGWAQVHYDYGNSVEDALVKLQYDFYYMRHWSLLMDLYIIFRTIGVVLKFKGT